MFKCEIGICRSHHLGKVAACIYTHRYTQPPTPTLPRAGSYHFHPQIGSDRPLRQRCLCCPHQQPCSPTQSCQPDYISAGWGGPKERRCPAGDRPLNTLSVLLPHICQYSYHLSPRLPQNQSECLYHSPAVLQKFNKLHLSLRLFVCLSSGLQTTSFSSFQWLSLLVCWLSVFFLSFSSQIKTNSISFSLSFLCFFLPLSHSQCLLRGAQLIYQLFVHVAAHYTDRATCLPSVD